MRISDWSSDVCSSDLRLHFMRHDVPVFVFGDPVFHGSYESLSPRDIPSLWDARVRVEVNNTGVLCTPLEWELILAVCLGAQDRIHALRTRMLTAGYDTRLEIGRAHV